MHVLQIMVLAVTQGMTELLPVPARRTSSWRSGSWGSIPDRLK